MTDFADCVELQELWLGVNPSLGSLFADREELRAAWEKHRVTLMVLFGSNGRRPAAWYEFSAPPGVQFSDDHERSTLWRAGVLDAEEARELEAEWYREFERAAGYDAKARRHHMEHCHVP